MNAPTHFARNVASPPAGGTLPWGERLQFAKWFLRHRGPVPAASTSRYQFVYHLARHLRGSSTLRIMSPLHVSQVTYAPVSRTVERWMQVAPAAARDVPVSPSCIFFGPASLWRAGRAQSEFDQPPRLRTSRADSPLVPIGGRTNDDARRAALAHARQRLAKQRCNQNLSSNTGAYIAAWDRARWCFARKPSDISFAFGNALGSSANNLYALGNAIRRNGSSTGFPHWLR